MQVVQLPRGNTALLREPEDVPERLRRPIVARTGELFRKHPALRSVIERQGSDAATDEDEVEAMGAAGGLGEVNDLVVLAFVAAWSFREVMLRDDGSTESGEKVPLTVDGLLSLPGDCYLALQTVAAPLYSRMLGIETSSTPDGVTDPDSPTGP